MEPEDQKVLERAYMDRKYIFEIMDQIKLKSGSKVLDLGCGCGGSTEILREYDPTFAIIGVDINHERILIANERSHGDINYCVGDAEKLEFGDNTFDLVFVRMLFEVCNNVDKIIDEIIRVVKQNGTVVIMGNLSTTPIIYPEPKYYSKYKISEDRLMQKMRNTVYNPLAIREKLQNRGVSKIFFHPYYKDSCNCEKKDIYNYYHEDKPYKDNLLVRAMLMNAIELEAFYKDLEKIIMLDNSVVLYSQYYIIGYLEKAFDSAGKNLTLCDNGNF